MNTNVQTSHFEHVVRFYIEPFGLMLIVMLAAYVVYRLWKKKIADSDAAVED